MDGKTTASGSVHCRTGKRQGAYGDSEVIFADGMQQSGTGVVMKSGRGGIYVKNQRHAKEPRAPSVSMHTRHAWRESKRAVADAGAHAQATAAEEGGEHALESDPHSKPENSATSLCEHDAKDAVHHTCVDFVEQLWGVHAGHDERKEEAERLRSMRGDVQSMTSQLMHNVRKPERDRSKACACLMIHLAVQDLDAIMSRHANDERVSSKLRCFKDSRCAGCGMAFSERDVRVIRNNMTHLHEEKRNVYSYTGLFALPQHQKALHLVCAWTVVAAVMEHSKYVQLHASIQRRSGAATSARPHDDERGNGSEEPVFNDMRGLDPSVVAAFGTTFAKKKAMVQSMRRCEKRNVMSTPSLQSAAGAAGAAAAAERTSMERAEARANGKGAGEARACAASAGACAEEAECAREFVKESRPAECAAQDACPNGTSDGNAGGAQDAQAAELLYAKYMCDPRVVGLFAVTHLLYILQPSLFEGADNDDDATWIFNDTDEDGEYVDSALMCELLSTCGIEGETATVLYDMVSRRLGLRIKSLRYLRRSRNLFRFMFLRQDANAVRRQVAKTIAAARKRATQGPEDQSAQQTDEEDQALAAELARCYLQDVNDEMTMLSKYGCRSKDYPCWDEVKEDAGQLKKIWANVKYSCFNKNDVAFSSHLIKTLDPHNVLCNVDNLRISYTGRFFYDLRSCFKVFDVSDDNAVGVVNTDMHAVLTLTADFVRECKPIVRLAVSILQHVREHGVQRSYQWHEADVDCHLDEFLSAVTQ